MSQESSEIKCPHCGEEIDVNEALSRQLEEELRKQYEDELDQKLKENRAELEQSLKEKIEEEQAEQIQSLQDELNEKSKQVRALNRAQADVARLKREKEGLKDEIELEAEKKLTKHLREETQKIRKSEQSKIQFQLSEREQVINQKRAASGSTTKSRAGLRAVTRRSPRVGDRRMAH